MLCVVHQHLPQTPRFRSWLNYYSSVIHHKVHVSDHARWHASYWTRMLFHFIRTIWHADMLEWSSCCSRQEHAMQWLPSASSCLVNTLVALTRCVTSRQLVLHRVYGVVQQSNSAHTSAADTFCSTATMFDRSATYNTVYTVQSLCCLTYHCVRYYLAHVLWIDLCYEFVQCTRYIAQSHTDDNEHLPYLPHKRHKCNLVNECHGHVYWSQ